MPAGEETAMNSRQRVSLALNHQQPDRVPLDLGGHAVTGMHVSTVYRLRQALGLDSAGMPVKVVEPYQMLGEIAPDLIAALGVDVVPLANPTTMFGFRNEGWKPWALFDGTPVLVPAGFNTVPEPDGDILLYPQGDRSAAPSGHMPQGGLVLRCHRPAAPDRRRASAGRRQHGGIRPASRGRYRALSPRCRASIQPDG